METPFFLVDATSPFSFSSPPPRNASKIFSRSSGATATWNRSSAAKNSRSFRNPSPSTSKDWNARRMGFPPSRNFSPILRRSRSSASRAESGLEDEDAKEAVVGRATARSIWFEDVDGDVFVRDATPETSRLVAAVSSRRTRAVAGLRAPLFVPGPTSVAAHDSSGSAHSTNSASATRPSASRSKPETTASTTSSSEATLNLRRIAATVSRPIRPSLSTPATRRSSRRAPSEDRAIDRVFSRSNSRTERRRPATEYTGTRTKRVRVAFRPETSSRFLFVKNSSFAALVSRAAAGNAHAVAGAGTANARSGSRSDDESDASYGAAASGSIPGKSSPTRGASGSVVSDFRASTSGRSELPRSSSPRSSTSGTSSSQSYSLEVALDLT